MGTSVSWPAIGVSLGNVQAPPHALPRASASTSIATSLTVRLPQSDRGSDGVTIPWSAVPAPTSRSPPVRSASTPTSANVRLSASEHDVDAIKNLLKLVNRNRPDRLREHCPIHSY